MAGGRVNAYAARGVPAARIYNGPLLRRVLGRNDDTRVFLFGRDGDGCGGIHAAATVVRAERVFLLFRFSRVRSFGRPAANAGNGVSQFPRRFRVRSRQPWIRHGLWKCAYGRMANRPARAHLGDPGVKRATGAITKPDG